jgi:K+-sensing histidine kinase KdpD
MTRSQFIKSRLIAGPPSLPWALILGLAFVIVPTCIRLAADPVIAGTAYVTYYPFVLVAALFLGWRGATAVAGAAAVLANFLFIQPRYVLFARLDDTLGTLFFVLASGLIIAVVDTLDGPS